MIRCGHLRSVPVALALILVACAGGNTPTGELPAEGASEPTATMGKPEIVYASPTGNASEVFSSNISDLVPRQLTSLGGHVAFPVWSPDGNRVLFVAMNEESANVIILDTESGESSVVLANNGNPADWGPRGEQILVTKDGANGRGLYLIIVATGAEERIDTGSTSDAYARWGRDGAAVVYESNRDGNPEIYLTNPESGETRRLTENNHLDEWPSLSRDSSQVAWASGTEEDKNLWVMNVDGSQKRQITESMMFGDAFPEWSPDGSQILLTVRENGQFMLKLIDLVSGQVTHIGEGAGASWK